MTEFVGVDGAADPDRQVAMVVDLNKCMGCQTCTVSCKTAWTGGEGQEHMWWNKVNTMPGEGSPRGWEAMGGGFEGEQGYTVGLWRFLGSEMRESKLPTDEEFGEYVELPHDDLLTGGEGTTVTSPDESPEWLYNYDEDRGAGEYPNSYFFYLPRLCNHCTRPACLEACPRDSIYKREEDGIVLVDEDDCHGYRFCVEACPYKVIYFNPERGTVTLGRDEVAGATPATNPPSDAAAAADGGVAGESASPRPPDDGGPTAPPGPGDARGDDGSGIAQKCIGCFPRIEEGVAPACVRQCPGRARFYGYLDAEGTPVNRLVNEWEVALPLHPEYGTEPNVYYVPPLSSPKIDETGRLQDEERIPREYLCDLFGEEVDGAIETLRRERARVENGGESELLETLIGFEWPADFFPDFAANPEEAKEPVENPGTAWPSTMADPAVDERYPSGCQEGGERDLADSHEGEKRDPVDVREGDDD